MMDIEKCLDEGRCKILCLRKSTFITLLNLKKGQPYFVHFDDLGLPEDLKVVNVNTNFATNCIEALAVHESFPPTAQGCQFMRVNIPDPIICPDFKNPNKLSMGPVARALLEGNQDGLSSN